MTCLSNFRITDYYEFTCDIFRVMYDEVGHYETFGHAYLVQNGVCARFVDRHHKAKTICGGFRVLSRSNNNGNLA